MVLGMVQAWYRHGTRHGTGMVQAWCRHGTGMVLGMVQAWCRHGTGMEPIKKLWRLAAKCTESRKSALATRTKPSFHFKKESMYSEPVFSG